jgi:hypothetical protein
VSLTGQRQEIADALSTADGVTGHPFRPRTFPAGAAWPLLDRLDRGPAHDFEATWRVVVILPDDEQRASEWFDAHHEDVAEALADFGHVDSIAPFLVATDSGDMEAMILTIRREA